MDTLPLEILLQIASVDYTVWRGMLVIRLFAEYTMSRNCRSLVIKLFSGGLSNYTKLCGKLHSYFDRPAISFDKISAFWYRHGKIHRRDEPAVIQSMKNFSYTGYKSFRIGKHPPADLGENYLLLWFRCGEPHRDNGGPWQIIQHQGGSRFEERIDAKIYGVKTGIVRYFFIPCNDNQPRLTKVVVHKPEKKEETYYVE